MKQRNFYFFLVKLDPVISRVRTESHNKNSSVNRDFYIVQEHKNDQTNLLFLFSYFHNFIQEPKIEYVFRIWIRLIFWTYKFQTNYV